MATLAIHIRNLDPRLKLAIAFVLGPGLWNVGVLSAFLCALAFLAVVIPLASSRPVGSKMVRSLLIFIVFWVGIKMVLDVLTGIPLAKMSMDALELAIRLAALLLLGLALALSTSARSMGLAIAWAIRPLVGRESAWRLSLSFALMVHFLPMCLFTMSQVRETIARRCPGFGFRQRTLVLPQAILRNLGQKTWNQTLAVAGRGLENAAAWEPEFAWNYRDWTCAVLAVVFISLMFFI